MLASCFVSVLHLTDFFFHRGWSGHSQNSCICRIGYRGGCEVGERLVCINMPQITDRENKPNIGGKCSTHACMLSDWLFLSIHFQLWATPCQRMKWFVKSRLTRYDRGNVRWSIFGGWGCCSNYDRFLCLVLPDLGASPRSCSRCHRGVTGAWWREGRRRNASL